MSLPVPENDECADAELLRRKASESLSRIRLAIDGLKEQETRVFLTCIVNRHDHGVPPQAGI